jgi:ribulose-bisphosphate carboxylase large chain
VNTYAWIHNFIATHSAAPTSGERFHALYRISGDEKTAYEKAKDICIEQTIEYPEDLVPDGVIRNEIFGRIEHFEMRDTACWAHISFAAESTAGELTQLLNVLFGNISLKEGIQLVHFHLSPSLSQRFPGPQFGIPGLRKALNAASGPLLATAIKPMGLTATGLATLTYQFACGGIDIIKDDHGLTNQPFAPFRERVARCAEAVFEAQEKTGKRILYAPNITAPHDEILPRAHIAKERGAGALLVSPGICGFDTIRLLASDKSINLPIIAHPALLGSYVLAEHGISHGCLFGTIARIAGADATIYPNFGGRFSFSREECADIVRACIEPYECFAPIFPMPGGGMTMERIPDMASLYGNDVIYLIGGGLFRHSDDLAENCRHFRTLINSHNK